MSGSGKGGNDVRRCEKGGESSGTKPQKRKVRFSDEQDVRIFEKETEPALKRQHIDPMEALEGRINQVCLGEAGGMDASTAAAQRAAVRKHHLLAGFEDDGAHYLGDIQDAEADYEDPEEMFNEAGVPWEPFHLKREREEGYFDEDGNYVEYKVEEVEDAWADDLANVEVDEEWLARVMSTHGRASAELATAQQEVELAPDQIASHKRRIVELLLPGENVLQALRRLARVRQPSTGGGEAPDSLAGDPLARHPRSLTKQAMPAPVRERFEELTCLSSALMEQGEYGVHSMTREQLQSALAGGRSQGGAADGREGHAALASVLAGGGGGPGGTAQRLAEQLLAAAGSRPVSGRDGDAVGNGSSSAADGGAATAGAGPAQAAVDADQDIFEDMPSAEPGGTSAGDSQQDVKRAAGDGGAPSAAADAEQHKRPIDAAAAGPSPLDVSMQEHAQQAGPQQQQQQQQQQQASSSGSAGHCAPLMPVGAAPPGLPPPDELDGFTLDDSTGLLYNSAMGAYYDPARQLFGDAASGLWYRYNTSSGQYCLAT